MTIIRRAGPEDLDHLLELAAEYCAADGHDFDPDRTRRGFVPLLVDDAHGVVWMVAGDGYAVVTWGWSIEAGGAEAILDEIYLRRRNEGHGSAALVHIEADCRARGIERIFLETEAANDGARRLYARHGYVAEDSIWMVRTLADRDVADIG